MRANSYSRYFGITTFGESHFHSMGLVIEDVYPGVLFPFEELNNALAKRRPAQAAHSSSRNEPDNYEIISGIFDGKTTGMPICILFKNIDHNSDDYKDLENIFKPGHADMAWFRKFKIYDYRGSGRASGRETISRVAAGACVKKLLGPIQIQVYPISIGSIEAKKIDLDFATQNPLYWCDPETIEQVNQSLVQTKEEQDSTGAIVEVIISSLPAGLGDPVFEKLDAQLAKAIMSIGSIKGIEFGEGFRLAAMRGSESNNIFSNNMGGIYGGVSDGSNIKMRIAIKPVPSISKPQQAFNKDMKPVEVKIKGRHDVCLVPRILPVIESMIRLVLADAIAHQNLVSSLESDIISCREALEKIDEEIVLALYRRFEIVKSLSKLKKEKAIPIFNKEREESIQARLADFAYKLGMTESLVEKIWELIFEESKNLQK